MQNTQVSGPMASDSGIRVSVAPTQSAFFAGEPFTVSITFTNVRTPSTSTKRTVQHSHKRAAHSISSAPLARPPTSPITPRTAVPPIAHPTRESTKTKKYERKGLIGVIPSDDGNEKDRGSHAVEHWKGKSMSTMLSPQDIAVALSSPGMSPLRDASLPANHPHARKHSVHDIQLENQLQVKELSSPALAPSGSASTSAFSLSLDTISEHNADTHQYPPKHRPPHLGLGLGPPPLGSGELKTPPHTAYPSTFAQPGTELVLYAYSQLSGSVTLGGDDSQGENRSQMQALNAVRFALQKKQAFGGGRMDISSTLDNGTGDMSPRRSRGHANGRHGRAASLSSSLMSFLAPPPTTQQPWSPGHKPRSPSIIASLISSSVSSPASIGSSGVPTITADVEEVPPETPLPIFEVQPAMLAVDLILAPGESRTYTYSLPLPSNLPPTYRGRIVKFAYHLSVGVCRASAGPSPSSPSGKGSTSQVMRVPIRLYNHVDISGVQRAYDLLWPVLHPPGKEQTAQVREMPSPSSSSPGKKGGRPQLSPGNHSLSQTHSPKRDTNPALDLRNYAQRLLDALPDPSGNGMPLPPPLPHEIEALSPTAEGEREIMGRGGGELTGCREAVEILTRNMRKVSYDVNKDGVKVAVLTFTKSAYRLGETVVGVVELNEISSQARVLKLSAMLEAHETLPSSLNPSSQGTKKLRKLHAEYHTALTLSTLRTSFALDIPSDATPAFQYTCAPPPMSLSTPFPSKGPREASSSPNPGGLTWTVRLCLLVGVASPFARKGVAGARVKGLLRDGPQGEWGTAWRATRGIAPLQNINSRAARRAQHRDAMLSSKISGEQQQQQRGWTSYLLSGLLTPGEREYHDGDEDIDSSSDDEDASYLGGGAPVDETRTVREGAGGVDVDLGGGDEGWSELRAETVECEVPIRVWPGNTAFKPLEVVFEV